SKNVTVDVGHNLLAAGKILEHFGKSKVVLVYNSLEDKEYRKILTLLRPILLEVHIIAIEDERAVNKRDLTDVLDVLDLPYQRFETIEEDKEYLVFGSFTVVEAFLKRLNG
ncbi:MAG: bifunctional folylpolyglutamate synthase/dihydrofolate synthase, partial [Thiovulaceae bacterium]|nr:bifunctional folylpolyglutamate synthase/dihydrofolate synthase [Sulfurimonadaceae bacterium]